MVAHRLRWLTFVSVLGTLGLFLHQPAFFAFSIFVVFAPLFWYDERTEATFRAAASVAFVSQIIAFATAFVYLGSVIQFGRGGDITRILVNVLAITYGLLLVSFAVSYIYIELKGSAQ